MEKKYKEANRFYRKKMKKELRLFRKRIRGNPLLGAGVVYCYLDERGNNKAHAVTNINTLPGTVKYLAESFSEALDDNIDKHIVQLERLEAKLAQFRK